MAHHWAAKAPSDVAERTWTPKPGDSVSSRTLTVSTGTATLESEIQGGDIVVTVTGGAVGITQVISASAVMGSGETITETIYLPVIATANALARTGLDVVTDVLELVVGIGNSPEASETAFALRKLTEMLASWSAQGADMGIPLPVATSTVFYCSDSEVEAIKGNLFLKVMPKFQQGWMPTPDERQAAMRGLQQIKTARLPRDRGAADYY